MLALDELKAKKGCKKGVVGLNEVFQVRLSGEELSVMGKLPGELILEKVDPGFAAGA